MSLLYRKYKTELCCYTGYGHVIAFLYCRYIMLTFCGENLSRTDAIVVEEKGQIAFEARGEDVNRLLLEITKIPHGQMNVLAETVALA